ncbi:MAG: hypothetical protein MR874_03565 [Coriobacteriaceae bacterium]|nr:hypothetical protein [Coriobacteriaceae bacterium]
MSDERRDVAERLRGLDIHDWYDYADEIDSLESAIECNVGQQFESQMWWHRLADLIDPTCHMCPAHAGGFGCDRCFTWFPDMETKPSFCPSCGARVVNCDGD